MDARIEEQARQVEELTRERDDLRRFSEPAIAKLQCQLSDARSTAEQVLRFKDAELANRRQNHIRDVEKLKADLRRETQRNEKYEVQSTKAAEAAMRFRDQANAAIRRAVEMEQHAARLGEQVRVYAEQAIHVHQIAKKQAAHFDQEAQRFNRQKVELEGYRNDLVLIREAHVREVRTMEKDHAREVEELKGMLQRTPDEPEGALEPSPQVSFSLSIS